MMLKSHLQPIVTYLFHPSAPATETSTPGGAELASQTPKAVDSVQPSVRYWSEATGPQPQIPSLQHRLLNKIGQLLSQVQASLTIDRQPKIQQRVDRQGQLYWRIYDPIGNQSHTFFTEVEVYQWLENRYYQ